MRKIVEYMLAKDEALCDFERMLDTHLADGWELYGNTFINKDCFYQAMVKYEEEK